MEGGVEEVGVKAGGGGGGGGGKPCWRRWTGIKKEKKKRDLIRRPLVVDSRSADIF